MVAFTDCYKCFERKIKTKLDTIGEYGCNQSICIKDDISLR